MNIELGLNKKVRRAYGIDEIALVPGNRTLDYDLTCLLYTSPSPRDLAQSRMPSSA